MSHIRRAESQLAAAIGKPAALILGTGFQANTSVLEALLDPHILGQEPLVFCDRLCHVSMLTTTRYLARIKRFQHNDLNHLHELLKKHAHSNRPKFILVESLYSMDGDTADLKNIIELAKNVGAFLYVDDAHAVGVYGAQGWGLAAEYANEIDVIMGTFSKALGGFGGYIACSQTIRDYLVNKCRGLIYSTGLPPAVLGAISAALEVVPTLDHERRSLAANAAYLRQLFQQHKLSYGHSTSHIIPWMIQDAERSVRSSELLAKEGILAAAIRPPSVPLGQSRIRFCLSKDHNSEKINALLHAIQKVEETA